MIRRKIIKSLLAISFLIPTFGFASTPMVAEFFQQETDLSNTTLTFAQDTAPTSYTVCLATMVSEYPVSVSNATALSLNDEQSVEIPFSNGFQFPFYDTTQQSVFIGSNGYLTFGNGDTSFLPNFINQTEFKRISFLFTDLAPNNGGTVSWQQLSNSFVVTFDEVPATQSSDTISCQVQLFTDGKISITHLSNVEKRSIIGISDGTGIPANIVIYDFLAAQECVVEPPKESAIWLTD